MKEKTMLKFSLYLTCALLLATILIFAGVTYAYFTASAELRGTLTSGNVKLSLSESVVTYAESGDLVASPNGDRIYGVAEGELFHDYGTVYPGQSIVKDPEIKNVGDRPEWVAAKVVLTDGAGDLRKLMGYPYHDGLDIEVLVSGGLLDESVRFGQWEGIEDVCYNDRYAMIQIPDHASGTYTFYFLMLRPLEKDASVTLFEKVAIPAQWNNTQLRELQDLKIYVQAFGVQTYGLDSCLDAMETAFPEHFSIH